MLSIVTMVLRESGLIEVYHDFELVQSFNMAYSSKFQFCVDISSDADFFSLRFLELEKSKPKAPSYNYRQIALNWRRQINYNHSKRVNSDVTWESIQLRSLNKYVRLYSNRENHQGYMLISHRSFISVYDLSDAMYADTERWRHLRVDKDEIISRVFFERITPPKR